MRFIVFVFFTLILTACGGSKSSPETDSDADGVADSVDAFPNDPKEFKDTDADGVGDNSDNCIDVNNTSQLNTDNDLLGDECDQDIDSDNVLNMNDAFPLDGDIHSDSDNDGVANKYDNCFLLANPDQKDSNDDGRGDLCGMNDSGSFVATNDASSHLDLCETNLAGDNSIEQQDCSLGRDNAFLKGGLAKVGSGLLGFDFTKISATGAPLVDQSKAWQESGSESEGTQWSCIKDNITGLIWERKTQSGMSKVDDVFMPLTEQEFIDNFAESVGNGPLTSCNGYEEGVVEKNCLTSSYIERINQVELCGYSNWRLPTHSEFMSISNSAPVLATRDLTFFEDSFIDSSFFNITKIQSNGYITSEVLRFNVNSGDIRNVNGFMKRANGVFNPWGNSFYIWKTSLAGSLMLVTRGE